ncbi:hypothetical protein GJ633_07405 [Halorubrum sp. CBA1125]|nr:hypothetical protein [Halorubrum sp. CBA1125]
MTDLHDRPVDRAESPAQFAAADGEDSGYVAGPPVVDMAEPDVPGRPCPLCETPMYHRHCKYVCPVHGVVYDCSDTFY